MYFKFAYTYNCKDVISYMKSMLSYTLVHTIFYWKNKGFGEK